MTALASSLKLYSHPLSSFCHKALIALYENGTAFEAARVDFGDTASLSAFEALWPMKKMPVLRDEARGCTVAEATIVIEYLDMHYPGNIRFLPADADHAWHGAEAPVTPWGRRMRPDEHVPSVAATRFVFLPTTMTHGRRSSASRRGN